MRFDIYLESGPQHRRTWVYVPGLPGCSVVAPTSAEAIECAERAIRERIAFLRRHGEPYPDPEPLDLVVAEHVIERKVLGFGQGTFPSDREPATPQDVARQLRWAAWSREELMAVAQLQPRPLEGKPAAGGRSVSAILAHVADAEWSYATSTLGTIPGRSAIIASLESSPEAPWDAMKAERSAVMARLNSLTPEQLASVAERGEGKPPRSVRRMLRRLLEHEWEHARELQSRLV
jgi:predicted RNase H-like HicB family nuclease/uncharacterized damage-inducible protein DinB